MLPLKLPITELSARGKQQGEGQGWTAIVSSRDSGGWGLSWRWHAPRGSEARTGRTRDRGVSLRGASSWRVGAVTARVPGPGIEIGNLPNAVRADRQVLLPYLRAGSEPR